MLQSKLLIVNDMFEEVILCLHSYLMLAYASVYCLVLWFGGKVSKCYGLLVSSVLVSAMLT